MLLVCSLTTNALAAEWYIEDGDIVIIADENGQIVMQGEVSMEDDDPVITGSGDSSITVRTNGAEAVFTISELTAYAEDRSVIDIRNGSKAHLFVVGNNDIGSSSSEYDDSFAAVHVGSADLTIDGDGYIYISNEGSAGAVFGSDEYENFTGSITIQGDVALEINDDGSDDGAAIGSGQYADFNGSVHITDHADVSADSPDRGAGIGSGEEGDFNGAVIIDEYAVVYAEGSDDSSGIGAGKDGSFGGFVRITDYAEVEVENDENGSPIGSSNGGDFTGLVIVDGHAFLDLDLDDSNTDTLIGANDTGVNDGTIIIGGNAYVQGDDEYYDTLGAESEEQIGSQSKIIIGKDASIWDYYGEELEGWTEPFYASSVEFKDLTEQEIQSYIDDWSASAQKDYQADDFWSEVVTHIRNATAGNPMIVEAVGREAMPSMVMEAVRESGVTLLIKWSGGETIVDQADTNLPEAPSYKFKDM